MDYLLEIAGKLLPSLNEPPETMLPKVREFAQHCDEAMTERDNRRSKDTLPSVSPVNTDPAVHREVAADVLARRPDLIPELLAAIKEPDYCPRFISDLVAAVLGTIPGLTIGGGRLATLLGLLRGHTEVAELFRTRPDRVAAIVVTTGAWETDRSRRRPPESSPAKTPASRPLGAEASKSGKMRAVARWVQPVAEAIRRMKRDEADALREVRAFLADSTEKADFQRDLQRELLEKPRLVLRLAEAAAIAVPFSMAFALELDEIEAARLERNAASRTVGDAPSAGGSNPPVVPLDSRQAAPAPAQYACRYPSRLAEEQKLLGLSFSGGGIRSATFNLGVIQALAGLGLLKEIDYLSTVSGGGYIGSWLSAWTKRGGGVREVERRLRTEPLANPQDNEARPMAFLRQYSNYLAPKTGFFSADFWSMVATWARNTLLNQLVLILFLGGALLLPWLVWVALGRLEKSGPVGAGVWTAAPISFVAGAVLLIVAAVVSARQLDLFKVLPHESEQEGMLGQGGVLLAIVLPASLACLFLSSALLASLRGLATPAFRAQMVLELFVICAVCQSIVVVGGRCWRGFVHDRVSSAPTRFWQLRAAPVLLVAILLSSLVGAATIVGIVWLLSIVLRIQPAGPFAVRPLNEVSWHWTVFGTPILLSLFSMIVVLKIGLLGRSFPDGQREWWSRVGAWLNLASLGWIAVAGLALYSPYVLEKGWDPAWRWVTTGGALTWLLSTVAGVQLGKGGGTPGVADAVKQPWIRQLVGTVAPYVFIAGMFVIVSTGAFWLVSGGKSPSMVTVQEFGITPWGSPLGGWLFAVPFGLMAASFLLSCRVDVNEFSMHHFYKNRLVRCYLGASRDTNEAVPPRRPNPFTGFDPSDDLWLADLQVHPCRFDDDLRQQKPATALASYDGPLPIVNTALNLVSGENLAWQERKAQSFVFTPLFSGYDYRDGAPRDRDPRLAGCGFRPTPLYGYPPYGISVGTAAAISGAAASPNSGYHSAPATALLLTMFNARLGWWLGNPRDEYNWLRSSPRRGLFYLLNELFGLTNDQTQFVNLSDGGHFENLGIYELVRRRCRFIIACDAEQDEQLQFKGLGMAVRNCRTDFGAEISIRASRIHLLPGTNRSLLHCVVGDIAYADGGRGTLVYMKASLTGDEAADVTEFAHREPTFPHHSTLGDQFFDESQFESYRKLGYHVASTSFAPSGFSGARNLASRFDELRDFWYPPSAAIEQHFATHLGHYDDLLERVRIGPGLEFLDDAFFGGTLSTDERNQLYLGVAMVDLMQRVYLDLNIEADPDHPHIRGWKHMFDVWGRHPAVISAWQRVAHTYGSRFRRFMESILPAK